MVKRAGRWAAVTLLAGCGLVPAFGQPVPQGFNERAVEKRPSPQDKAGIWVLDFHFMDPRVVTVDIPGRGRRIVWYLRYEVSNNTGAARNFIPDFVWVCHDEDTVHHDQVLPKAMQAIRALEDPDGTLDLKNSVQIASSPIPYGKEFNEKGERIAFPKTIAGVATWDDINPKSTQFSIYVYGLSDGYSQVDGPDGKPIIRRKTLQLKFKRLGDEFKQSAGQIRYLGHEWIYATADLPPSDVPDRPGAAPTGKRLETKPAAKPEEKKPTEPKKP